MSRNLPNESLLLDTLASQEHINISHLVRVELPGTTESNKAYSYISDALYPIEYEGQIYRPKYVTSVGDITEVTDAKKTSTSLVLNAAAIYANESEIKNVVFSHTSFTYDGFDLEEELARFLPGDRVVFSSGPNSGLSILISNIKSPATNRIEVSFKVQGSFGVAQTTQASATYSIPRQELTAFVDSNSTTSFNKYINRKVTIYRQYADRNNVALSTFVLFEGVIVKGAFQESETKSTMTWTLDSNWANFSSVVGRKSTDSHHRDALAGYLLKTGKILKSKEYVQDLGFMHAEAAINVLAQFLTPTEKLRSKKKKKWKGSKTSYWLETVWEPTETKVNFNLESQYIPIIYGVNRVKPSIAFADLLTAPSDFSVLATVQVLCEGPIAGILDIYSEDKSHICLDAVDSVVRGFGSPSVSPADAYTCYNRADAGDTLRAWRSLSPKATGIETTVAAAVSTNTITLQGIPAGTLMSYSVLDVPYTIELTFPTDTTLALVSFVPSTPTGITFVLPPQDTAVTLQTPAGKILNNFIADGTTLSTVKLYNPLVLGNLGDFVSYAGAPQNLKIVSASGAGSVVLNQTVSIEPDTTITVTKPVGEYEYTNLNNGPSHFVSSSADHNDPLYNLAGISNLRAPRDWRSIKGAGQFFSDGMGVAIDTLAETYLFSNGGENQKASPFLSRVGTSYVDGSQEDPTVPRGSAVMVATDQTTQDLREKLTPGLTYVVIGCTNATGATEDAYTRSLIGATFAVACIKEVTHGSTHQIARVEKAFFTRETLNARKPSQQETAQYQTWSSEYKYYTAKNLRPTAGASTTINTSTNVDLILTLRESDSAAFLFQGPEKTREVSDVRISQIKFTDVQKGFKTQDAFFDSFPIDYWGESHLLRDTAYITNINKITYDDSETEIPEYAVQGKYIDCHNYDNSYTVTDATEIDKMSIGQEVVVAGAEQKDILALASKRLSSTETIQIIAVKNTPTDVGIQIGYLDTTGTQTDATWPGQVLDGTVYPLPRSFDATNPNNDTLVDSPARYSVLPEDIQDIHWDGTFLYVLDLIGIATYVPPTNLISSAALSGLPSLANSWKLIGHTRIWGPAAPRQGEGISLLSKAPKTFNWPRIPLTGAIITEGQETTKTLVQTRNPTAEAVTSATEAYTHQRCYFDAQNIDRISIGDEVYRGSEYLGVVLSISNQDDVDWNFSYGRGWDWTNVFGETQFKDAPYPALSTTESRSVIIEGSSTVFQNESLTFKQKQIEVFVPSTGFSTWSDVVSSYSPKIPASNLWSGYMYDRTDSQILVYDKTLLTRVTTPTLRPLIPKTLPGNIGSPFPQTNQYYVNTSEDRNRYSTLFSNNTVSPEFWVEGSYGNWQCLAPYIGLNFRATFVPPITLLQRYTEVIDNDTAGPDFSSITRLDTFESTYHPPTKVISQADNPTLPDRATAFSVLKDEDTGTWKRNFIQDHKNNFYGRNKLPTGMTSDGTTIWVCDWILPPSTSSGDKAESVWRSGLGHPIAGISQVWDQNEAQKVAVYTHNKFYGTGKIYAYNATTLVREPSLDINTHSTLPLKDSATTKTVSKIENALPRTLELSNEYDKQFDEFQHSNSFHASSYSQASTSVLHVADVTGIEVGDTITFPSADTDSYIRPCLFSASHDPAWTKSALRPANNSILVSASYADTPTDKQYNYASFSTIGGRPAPASQAEINSVAGPQRYRHAFQHDLIHVARVASVHPESNTVFVNKYVEMDLTQNTQVIFSKDQSYFNGRVYEEAYPPAAFPYLAPNKYEFGGTTYPQYEQFDFNLRTKAPMPYDIHIQGLAGSSTQTMFVLNKGESHARTLNEQYTQRDAVEYIDNPFKHDLSYVTVFDVTTKKPTGKTIWLGHDSVGICADSTYLYSLEERAVSVSATAPWLDLAVRTLTYTLNSYNISGLGNGTVHKDYVERLDASTRLFSSSPLYYKHTNYQAPGLVEAAADDAYGSWVSSFTIQGWSTSPAAAGVFKHGLAIDPINTGTRSVPNTYDPAEGPYIYPYFTTIEQGGSIEARIIQEAGTVCNLTISGSDTKALSAFTFDPTDTGRLLAVGGANPIRPFPFNYDLQSLENKARIYEKDLYLMDYGVITFGGLSDPKVAPTTSGLLGGTIAEAGETLLIESGVIPAATSARYERDDGDTVYVPQTSGADEITIKSISALSYTSAEGNVFAFLGDKRGWAGYNYRPTNTAASWDDITVSPTAQYHTAFEDVTATSTNRITKILKRRNIEGTMEYAVSLETSVSGVSADSYRLQGVSGGVSVRSRYIYPTIISPNQLGAEDSRGPNSTFSLTGTSTAAFSKLAVGTTAAIVEGINFTYTGTYSFQEFFMTKIPANEVVYSSTQAKFDAGWGLKANSADFNFSELTLTNNGIETSFRLLPSPGFIDTALYDSGYSFAWISADSLYYVFITPVRSFSFTENPGLETSFYTESTFQDCTLSFKDMVKLSQAEASLSSKEKISFLSAQGTSLGQVIEYDPTNSFAVIDGISSTDFSYFDEFTKYKLYDTSLQDYRVSTNPALQLLDYLSSSIYGRDLEVGKDLDLESFLAGARACDAPSGVTVVIPAFDMYSELENQVIAAPREGDIYQVLDPVFQTKIIFEGTVSQVALLEQGGLSYYQVDFINVIGKLGKKYNRWQKLGTNYVWNKEGNLRVSQDHAEDFSFYDMLEVTGPDETTSVGTWPLLRKVSGLGAPFYYLDIGTPAYTVTHTGTPAEGILGLSVTPAVAATISVGDITINGNEVYYVTDASVSSLIELNQVGTSTAPGTPSDSLAGRTNFQPGDTITFLKTDATALDSLKLTSDNNPLVKQYRQAEGSFGDTGYSLYDCDNVKYWKYLGWEDQSQDYVTRHQTNMYIDTSKSSLEITNDMLQHFNGMLRYSNGQYSLSVKARKANDWKGDTIDLNRRKNVLLDVNTTSVSTARTVDFIEETPTEYKQGDTITFPDGQVASILSSEYARGTGLGSAILGASYIQPNLRFEHPSASAASDGFGYKVVIDGDTMAVSRDGTLGGVTIYRRVNDLWAYERELDGISLGYGRSLALRGDTLIVGDPGAGNNGGAVYIWVRTAGTWNQEDYLFETNSVKFGTHVAWDGTTLVVTDPSFDTGIVLPAPTYVRGRIHMYTRSGTTWTLEASIEAGADFNHINLGSLAVAVDGDTIVTGNAYRNRGAITFFHKNTTWAIGNSLTSTDIFPVGTFRSLFGNSLVLDGTTLFVGQPGYYRSAIGGTNVSEYGKVFIYEEASAQTWGLLTTLATPASATKYGLFGWSLAKEGNNLLVGAPQQNSFLITSGAAYYYKLISGVWQEVQEITQSETAHSNFGFSVALSGALAGISAPSVSGSLPTDLDPPESFRNYNFTASTVTGHVRPYFLDSAIGEWVNASAGSSTSAIYEQNFQATGGISWDPEVQGTLQLSRITFQSPISWTGTVNNRTCIFTPLRSYRDILEEDIIGTIKISDKGAAKQFNSISATILDPQAKFSGRDISFFNSEYLEEDSYIPKEGNYSQPGVTNYFNARINVKQALDSSRYSLNVEFTAAPHLITLVAGEIITLTKNSYGWDRKEFRISKLVLAKDGTIKVTATEHTDQTYCLTAENTITNDSLLSSALPNTSNSQAF